MVCVHVVWFAVFTLDCDAEPHESGVHVSLRACRYQLQTLFARLCLSQRQAIATRGLTTSFGNFNSFEQHDAQELCRKLFEHLDDLHQEQKDSKKEAQAQAAGADSVPSSSSSSSSSPSSSISNPGIDDLFAGTAVNYLESCDGVNAREVPEKFLDLEVRVHNPSIHPLMRCCCCCCCWLKA